MSCSVLMLSRADVKPNPEIVIRQLFTAAPLSIIHHFNYYPFKNRAWKGTAAVVTTAKRQKCLPRMPGKEQCTGLSSLPCRRREHLTSHPSAWWTCECCMWRNPQKKYFVLECPFISLEFILLHFYLCRIWPMTVDWAAAYASATFLWETQRLRTICAYSCYLRHCDF